MPAFSIIVPAYNNANLVTRCLESIKRQTFADWEAVIVNDASPDDMHDVIHDAANGDDRFVIVEKTVNEGRHLARKTGTETATGDYLLYLDADDELASDRALAQLDLELARHPSSILRFGLVAAAEEGTPESTAEAFTSWSNLEPDENLSMDEIMKRTFCPSRGWEMPWHITHRTFEAKLAKKAFSSMTDERLERAEDAYEYFVMASLAADERSRCDIIGYRYHMGVGVTNVKELTATAFEQDTANIWKCCQIAREHADATGDFLVGECAQGLTVKLLEAVGNDLAERVADDERAVAERKLVEIVGEDRAAVELWRFVRDRSWRYLATDFIPDENDELFREEAVARTVATDPDCWRHEHNKALAEKYLAELRQRIDAAKTHPDIRIFVSTHKHTASFESEILQHVQVGSAHASERFWETLHDDSGENISTLNPLYCELTTQYWAWKNVDADYYGFCHYRRYFDFSDTRHKENNWGEIMERRITASTQQRYGLDDDTMRKLIEGYDIVTTEFKDVSTFPDGSSSTLAQWHDAPNLVDEDFENMLAILLDRHPEYEEAAEQFVRGKRACFCNMFIMRKSLFFDYCSWLFPLLDEFMGISDFSTYNHETARTPGHLSERLFNIYFLHHMQNGANWKHKELQCVRFTDPYNRVEIEKPYEWSTDFKPVIPVVLASDNNYVPMLTATIYSMLKNASPRFHYHIVVMTTNISADNQKKMTEFLSSFGSITLDFHFVWDLVKEYKLTTNNPHIGIETYYRFLIQDVLDAYDKVLYLDSDLIVRGDVSELFQVELGETLIGAVRDVDYLGNLNMKDGNRLAYTNEVLKLDNPYDYFQAGVLLLNTKALRDEIPVTTWLEHAQDTRYIYNDQDILNACCEGRVTFLDPAWNVMHDGWNRIDAVCRHAPAAVFDAYLEARKDEKVIHYAGSEKPWNTMYSDRMDEFWNYARETPYYEQLIAMFAHDCGDEIEELRRAARDFQIIGDENLFRRIVDPILPPGSQRREVVRSAVKTVIRRP